MNLAICTIVAKNYLAQARVLMSSVRKWNPEAKRIVILVDQFDGYFDPSGEDFETILSQDLPIPASKWFHFKYSILELNTAVKPYALEFLIRRYSLARIVYLDPDIQLFSPLQSLFDTDSAASIFLTPHLTAPNTDERQPGDLDILRAGAYNLGFLALRATEESNRFLRWWQSKLYELCVVDLARGLFVDQRWVDLVPGLFSGVCILRDPGYNVAYWNLSHRKIQRSGAGYTVNGEPLRFFHYSGFDPAEPDTVSKHQNRYQLNALGDARALFGDYREALLRHAYLDCLRWPYAYGFFANGEPVPDIGRPVHHESPAMLDVVDDPYSDAGFRAFVDLWNQPAVNHGAPVSGISRMAFRIYGIRPDVQAVMPDIFGTDRIRFLQWLLSNGKAEHGLRDYFLSPAMEALAADERAAPHPGRTDLPLEARRIYRSRKDLQRRFSDPFGEDQQDYLTWLLTYGQREYKWSIEMILPLRRQWEECLASRPGYFAALLHRLRLSGLTASANGLSTLGAWRSAWKTWWDRSDPGVTSPLPAQDHNGVEPSLEPRTFGVNIVGYLRAEIGVGEAARSSVRSVRTADIPFGIRNIVPNAPCRNEDRGVEPVAGRPDHHFNLFHINADMTPSVFAEEKNGAGSGHYNIGYWAWELEQFPDRWSSSFDYYREIWTLSTFCQRAISRNSPVPVVTIPLSLEIALSRNYARADFGIPAEPFVFLTVFDVLSVVQRKNPSGVIAAFVQAFQADPRCRLVLKVNNGSAKPGEIAKLREYAAGYPVTIIDRTLTREETYGLMSVADSVVSLHRAEGFGLTLAEAMYLGKPVIATGYSGNLDFTRPDNSLLVDYRLVPIGPNQEPYDASCLWADPDITHAASHMRNLVASRELYSRLSRDGESYVRTHLSPAAVGAQIKERLRTINRQRTEPAGK